MKTVITNMNVSYGATPIYMTSGGDRWAGEPQTVELDLGLSMDVQKASDITASIRDKHFSFDDVFPGNVVVKCRHCGQWCARKTACIYCGAPVD